MEGQSGTPTALPNPAPLWHLSFQVSNTLWNLGLPSFKYDGMRRKHALHSALAFELGGEFVRRLDVERFAAHHGDVSGHDTLLPPRRTQGK